MFTAGCLQVILWLSRPDHSTRTLVPLALSYVAEQGFFGHTGDDWWVGRVYIVIIIPVSYIRYTQLLCGVN